MTPDTIHSIFNLFEKHNPTPETELVYEDPYTLLIAVMLSAQTTDMNVNKATEKLFKRAKTPEKMLQLSLEEIEEAIKTLNFFKTKAKNILGISHALVENCHGSVPKDRASLESLPGVGRKTANVVLNVAFHEPTLAVDTHIHRVSNRLGLCATKTPLDTEQALLKVIPKEALYHAHHWLILHGRYICKARKPLCQKCFLEKLCEYKDKEL